MGKIALVVGGTGMAGNGMIPNLLNQAGELVALGVHAQALRVQVGGQAVGTGDDLGVGEAPVALNDEGTVRDGCSDGVGDVGNREQHISPKAGGATLESIPASLRTTE